MRQVKRQTNPTLRAAVMDSIARREAAALKKLAAHTYAIADRDARIDAIVQDYLARSTEQREQTLIMTGVNDDRREINERIRRALRSEQVLKGPELQASVLVQRDLTRPELTQPKSYQIGDIIRFGRSYSRLGVTRDRVLDGSPDRYRAGRGGAPARCSNRRLGAEAVRKRGSVSGGAPDPHGGRPAALDSERPGCKPPKRRRGSSGAVDADRGVANVVGSGKNVTIGLDREQALGARLRFNGARRAGADRGPGTGAPRYEVREDDGQRELLRCDQSSPTRGETLCQRRVRSRGCAREVPAETVRPRSADLGSEFYPVGSLAHRQGGRTGRGPADRCTRTAITFRTRSALEVVARSVANSTMGVSVWSQTEISPGCPSRTRSRRRSGYETRGVQILPGAPVRSSG